MKKAILLIGLFFLAISLPAGSYAAEINKSDLLPVKIYIASHDDVYKFGALGVNIEELRDGYIEARISQSKIDELISLGWKVEEYQQEILYAKPPTPEGYHNYDSLTVVLDNIHVQYPNITKLLSMGTSVQGRQLWALLISDNPDSNENEAELRFTATIHGNEPVGTEISLYMIDSLTKCYGIVPEITDLVNNREIWFVPMINPDGNALGNIPNARYNANSIDLNRNFPVPDGNIGDDSTYTQQPETQAFISFWNSKRIVLSETYHGGALVANYPWDYTLARCPDDALVKEVSLGYSRQNIPMYNSTVFDSGVTNGADWYVVAGSLQDWSYQAISCVDITLEISLIKWPVDSTLPGYWNDNRNAMLYFIRQAGWGVQGIVTDSLTGLPINWASVVPVGIDKPVYTDAIGDYHRMLITGQYDLIFTAIGYHDKTIGDVRVKLDSLTNLDVQLAPILVSGVVCDSASGEPISGVLVEVIGLRSDTADANGQYSLRWNQDDYYSLKASASGYRAVIYDSLKFANDSTINFNLSIDTGVAGGPGDAKAFITRLEAPYPNPSRSSVILRYQLAATGEARLDIYDITGRLVKSLPQRIVSAGAVRTFIWDGNDQKGRKVSAGIYFCRLTAGGANKTQRMVILK